MSSNLKVNAILPSTGTNVAIGTAGGSITMVGNVDIDINSGISTFNDIHISDKIVHDGDTNTSLRFPAADTFSVETAGSERFRITSTGNIGLGVASPQGGGGDLSVLGNKALRWSNSGGTQYGDIYADTSSNIVFRNGSSSTERLRITSGGLLQLNNDSAKIQLGASQDLSIYHDGSSNRIIAANADLILQSNNYNIRSENGSSTYLNIDSSGRVMMGGATSAHGSTNRDDLVIGAVDQANQTGITIGSASASGISFADAGNDTAGGIYYSHGNDDMIFYAGGNQRGKVKDDSGVTGIEHHRFIPFLIGYDIQSTSSITMTKGFGGMSRLPINADGDKAYMSYVTHWRHRQYAGVYFWYGASGNTSGATFDWDFTVWNASSGQGYSASSHTFTIQSGTMSNGKMYRLSALSSWPAHAAAKFVQFEIDFDELQGSTSLQLSGLELVEYTTP